MARINLRRRLQSIMWGILGMTLCLGSLPTASAGEIMSGSLREGAMPVPNAYAAPQFPMTRDLEPYFNMLEGINLSGILPNGVELETKEEKLPLVVFLKPLYETYASQVGAKSLQPPDDLIQRAYQNANIRYVGWNMNLLRRERELFDESVSKLNDDSMTKEDRKQTSAEYRQIERALTAAIQGEAAKYLHPKSLSRTLATIKTHQETIEFIDSQLGNFMAKNRKNLPPVASSPGSEMSTILINRKPIIGKGFFLEPPNKNTGQSRDVEISNSGMPRQQGEHVDSLPQQERIGPKEALAAAKSINRLQRGNYLFNYIRRNAKFLDLKDILRLTNGNSWLHPFGIFWLYRIDKARIAKIYADAHMETLNEYEAIAIANLAGDWTEHDAILLNFARQNQRTLTPSQRRMVAGFAHEPAIKEAIGRAHLRSVKKD